MLRFVSLLLMSLLVFGNVNLVQAEEEAAPANTTQYIYLSPAFLVNYGSKGPLRYLRCEIALKVSSMDASIKVDQHKPYLRNDLVLLLSAQEPSSINTPEGREKLRKEALDAVRGRLMQLEGTPYVNDLYFSNFVVQN